VLTKYVGYLLRRAYARSVDCERACLDPDVGLREIALLATLRHNGPTSQRQLGGILGVNRTVMVKLVDSAEERGWVVRERNADDRRSYALRLTDAGLATLRDAHSDLQRLEAGLTHGLDDVERTALGRHLRTLLGEDEVVDVEGLSETTAILVEHAHRTLRQRAMSAFESLGIDPRDFGILAVVAAEQPCSQVLVAARIGVTPPAVQGAIDDLVARGLLRRTTNTADRRMLALSVTPDGETCLAKARAVATTIQDEVTGTLGRSAEAELRGLLQKLIA
jgi:DNA-binding MarR family transcriptional regulator